MKMGALLDKDTKRRMFGLAYGNERREQDALNRAQKKGKPAYGKG